MTNKLTVSNIFAKIRGETYIVLPDGRTTLCILTLENGFTIKGLSACVDASNFDITIGRRFSHEDAVRQIWPLEGYLLAQRLYEGNEWTDSVGAAEGDTVAPFGLKKDGTPKLKPGRKNHRLKISYGPKKSLTS